MALARAGFCRTADIWRLLPNMIAGPPPFCILSCFIQRSLHALTSQAWVAGRSWTSLQPFRGLSLPRNPCPHPRLSGSPGRPARGPRAGSVGTCRALSVLWASGRAGPGRVTRAGTGRVTSRVGPGRARPATGFFGLAGSGGGAFRLREVGLRPLSIHPLGSGSLVFWSLTWRQLRGSRVGS